MWAFAARFGGKKRNATQKKKKGIIYYLSWFRVLSYLYICTECLQISSLYCTFVSLVCVAKHEEEEEEEAKKKKKLRRKKKTKKKKREIALLAWAAFGKPGGNGVFGPCGERRPARVAAACSRVDLRGRKFETQPSRRRGHSKFCSDVTREARPVTSSPAIFELGWLQCTRRPCTRARDTHGSISTVCLTCSAALARTRPEKHK